MQETDLSIEESATRTKYEFYLFYAFAINWITLFEWKNDTVAK